MFTPIAAILGGLALGNYEKERHFSKYDNLDTLTKMLEKTGFKDNTYTNPDGTYNSNDLLKAAYLGSTLQDKKQLDYIMQAAIDLDILPRTEHNKQFQAYNKFRANNYDVSKLSFDDNLELQKLFETVYNSGLHKIDEGEVSEKLLDMVEGTGAALRSLGVPAPSLLDTDFADYLREIEPLKHYTNKELADLYNIDFDFDSIKADYDKSAEAQVRLQDWISNALANNAERDNITNETSYLDAIRNAKATSIQNGVSSGARAAAELLANLDTIKNKAVAEHDVASERFKIMDDALLNRAQTALNANNMYTGLANTLGAAANQMYADDVERIGQDHMFKANTIGADSALRAARAGANAVMNSAYNLASAQNAGNVSDALQDYNYFKDISLPANDYDVYQALQDYKALQYTQATGYLDSMYKFGQKE